MSFLSNFLNNSGILENSKIADEYERLLLQDEQIEVGFKLNEDTFIFTNMRLVLEDVKKGDDRGIEYLSLPYSKISNFSIQTKKSFNSKATLKIWLNEQNEPKVEKEFSKSVDVYEVQKILAGHVLR
ncbi:PH domain-containing protein [Marivirga salinae]|uniref:PH domain-containing protein n=1 Tax=Marivirga salinarum TaxID=3059078 RepID=A0AA49JB66_9BACT|nr:PH domain-containing protein [Marivirga sp. BDSF4-3]WKK73809.1 PH domain-containing protein [Marivirga sp. BDSF4-3]